MPATTRMHRNPAAAGPVWSWDPAQVAGWLRSRPNARRFGRHAARFETAGVTGAALLELDAAELARLGLGSADEQDALLDRVAELGCGRQGRPTLEQDRFVLGMTSVSSLFSVAARDAVSSAATPPPVYAFASPGDDDDAGAADYENVIPDYEQTAAVAEPGLPPLPPRPRRPATSRAGNPAVSVVKPAAPDGAEAPYAVLKAGGHRRHRPTCPQLVGAPPAEPAAVFDLAKGTVTPAAHNQARTVGLIGRFSNSRRHVHIFDVETGERVRPEQIAEHQLRQQLQQRRAQHGSA